MNATVIAKRIVATTLGALLLGAGAAHAVDLRSWDRKINDATQRFVVLAALGNQAVLDKETQLVWERSPAAVVTQWWVSAQAICGVKSVGGRKGWRLPSLHEFMTLIDPSVSSGVMLPASHPFAGIQSTDIFWTTDRSSSISNDGVVAVHIGTSQLISFSRQSYSARPWCVRGPSSPGPN